MYFAELYKFTLGEIYRWEFQTYGKDGFNRESGNVSAVYFSIFAEDKIME